jgi:hypothetical protein
MRRLRLTLVGPVILALLGLGAPAAAQSPEPAVQAAPSSATGTLEFTEPAAVGEGGVPVTHDESTVHVHTWTSSDPRLTGTATYTGAWNLYDPLSEDCDVPDANTPPVYEIVNEGGGWRCGGVRAPVPGPDGASNVFTLVFIGTGGYEGLYVYMLVDWSTEPFTFSALITPNSVPLVSTLPG